MDSSKTIRNPVSILMYHQVGSFSNPRAHRAVYCDVGRFRAQMALLSLTRHRVISLADACKGVFEGSPLPSRSVVLTFDDGYDNFREYAWPILKQHGFPATVFLVGALTGRQAVWRSSSESQARLMDMKTIRRLCHEGVNFGSHTMTHCRLSKVDRKQQREEIFNSKTEIENILGKTVDDFCYPYGDYDIHARDLVAEAGYRTALTCIRGSANTAENRYEIPRKAISYGDNLIGFMWKIHAKNKRKDNSEHNPQHLRQR